MLLAASLWSGSSEAALMLAKEEKITLVLSEEILQELEKVLGYEEILEKIVKNRLRLKFTASAFRKMGLMVKPEMPVLAVKDDPSDNKILECALEGKAQFILTYDKHLLQLGSYEGICIITPDEFLGGKRYCSVA